MIAKTRHDGTKKDLLCFETHRISVNVAMAAALHLCLGAHDKPSDAVAIGTERLLLECHPSRCPVRT